MTLPISHIRLRISKKAKRGQSKCERGIFHLIVEVAVFSTVAFDEQLSKFFACRNGKPMVLCSVKFWACLGSKDAHWAVTFLYTYLCFNGDRRGLKGYWKDFGETALASENCIADSNRSFIFLLPKEEASTLNRSLFLRIYDSACCFFPCQPML